MGEDVSISAPGEVSLDKGHFKTLLFGRRFSAAIHLAVIGVFPAGRDDPRNFASAHRELFRRVSSRE